MSGKKGRSGRLTKVAENYCAKHIDQVKTNTHRALALYTNHILKTVQRDPEALTEKQAQHLISLHIKHAPDPKPEGGNPALELLSRMALAGMQEIQRIREASEAKVHKDIIDTKDYIIIDDAIIEASEGE